MAEWPVVFKDDFTTNGNHWGLGTRDDGVCQVERIISDGCYRLRLHNRFHWNAYVGGDSNCYAPPVYYLTAEAQRLSGQHDAEDGFGLLFEEVNDGCHSILRIRDAVQCFSIYRAQAGGDAVTLYQDRKFHPAIRPAQSNRVAILAEYERHWFYINDVLVFNTHIPRIPDTRLDVAIVSGAAASVSCHYRNFTVRVPPGVPFVNGTPTMQ
jgi:hypothetical protein